MPRWRQGELRTECGSHGKGARHAGSDAPFGAVTGVASTGPEAAGTGYSRDPTTTAEVLRVSPPGPTVKSTDRSRLLERAGRQIPFPLLQDSPLASRRGVYSWLPLLDPRIVVRQQIRASDIHCNVLDNIPVASDKRVHTK